MCRDSASAAVLLSRGSWAPRVLGHVLGTSEKKPPEAGEERHCRVAASDQAGGIQHSSSGVR